MNQTTAPNLPPNPYKRSPIKKREDLAGRARELKSIRYYLALTAAGQSPHLALIGQRGVGKTSLLNGAESIAKDCNLLPVRLDMNEQKASSQWIFWHDLYQTLALAMAKAGCWGGLQGKVYAELLRMIYARQPACLDNAVLQVPFVFSCHQGDTNSFECPDALVVHDFEECIIELQSKGLTGIALLIDEADCLGKNVSLLQIFRNIFQVVDNCSLLLAGTEAVFPALSEVFSPIPRQFHRIDIKPFARWSDTMELVLRPLPKDIIEMVAPETEVLRDLHELCGGVPDEVQLYCHHMYRSVEDGSTKQMSLSPKVFREVLREYRSNSPANVDAILNAIECLPDALLFQSMWVSRRNLTLEENTKVSILRKELKNKKLLSPDERAAFTNELKEGYRKLFESGITTVDNCIRLAGAPLTAGFWKSFVEVERGNRWTWDDNLFAESLCQPIIISLGIFCGSSGRIESIGGQDAVNALQLLRAGKTPTEFDEGMGEMIVSALASRRNKSSYVADVTLRIESSTVKQNHVCRFFEKPDTHLKEEQFHEWIENHKTFLAGNDIVVCVTSFIRWELPSPLELHRLGRISGHRIPEVFGPTESEQAISKFEQGDVAGCMAIFSSMLYDTDDAITRSNLAFCQLLTGDVVAGLENATKALSTCYYPIIELNKGVGEFLLGNRESAIKSLRNSLHNLIEPGSKYNSHATYVLVLDTKEMKCTSHRSLPVDAAVIINLRNIGGLTTSDLEAELTKLHPEMAQSWLAKFTEP